MHTERIEIKLEPADKALIEQAAVIARETVSAWVRRELRAAAGRTVRNSQDHGAPGRGRQGKGGEG
ncbi:MAG: hypothetical protein A2Y78_04745 [Acidobacteria bacterium RBG_13_68_16]|nr:MAG: hypothetical protein A2Y78_04745 [Acidobacteria bacterium RBG_13_68_16]